MTWRRAWLAVLALVVGMEAAALLRRAPGDTLSEQVWTVLGAVHWTRPVLAAFLGWLAYHFLAH